MATSTISAILGYTQSSECERYEKAGGAEGIRLELARWDDVLVSKLDNTSQG